MKCILLICCLGVLTACSTKDERPNMVVILVDDMRWDEFGAAGHSYIQTPNIDRVAKEGVMFTNAFATTPLCSPSRACFLTGQYAHRNGIVDNTSRDKQSHELKTFPQALDQGGYETAFMGKWHMGNDDSPRKGFDRWVSLKGQGEANDPNLNIDGERTQVKGYVTDVLTNFALRFIRKERTSPFLLYFSHKALHPNIFQANDGSTQAIGEGGFVAADRHKGMYADKVFNRRPNAYTVPSDKPALMRTIEGVPPLSRETATAESTIRERAEMLMAVDESLGQIMQLLDSLGKLDNTVIVFTSDHGYWYGEHSLNDERRLAYEEGIRIPFLIRYPRSIPAGTTRDAMVQSIDMAPTLLHYADLFNRPFGDGMPLQLLIQDANTPWRDKVYIEYFSDTVFPRIFKMGYHAVRDNQFKYIQYDDLTGMDELYDLKVDPYELKNVATDTSYFAVASRLRAAIMDSP
jgi:N-acetylglucosamine-6-sulfatase